MIDRECFREDIEARLVFYELAKRDKREKAIIDIQTDRIREALGKLGELGIIKMQFKAAHEKKIKSAVFARASETWRAKRELEETRRKGREALEKLKKKKK